MLTLNEAQQKGVAPWTDIVWEDFKFVVYRDRYPVTEGHLLFVPTYPADTVIDDCFAAAMKHGREQVSAGAWDGFNVGINCGEAAGQTVMYPHVHLIPRRKGDMENPQGGVRHVIPGKGNYKA